MLVFFEMSMVTYIFYFIISMRTVSSITEKNQQKSMASFLAKEINSNGEDIMGRTSHVQNRSELYFF